MVPQQQKNQQQNNSAIGLKTLKQIYIVNATARFGFTEKKTTELLAKKFGSFDPNKKDEYDQFLAGEREKILSYFSKRNSEVTYVTNEVCPICGAPIINDDTLIGKYSKINGWRCKLGGKLHYWQARTNLVMKNTGKPNIYEEYTENAIFPGEKIL